MRLRRSGGGYDPKNLGAAKPIFWSGFLMKVCTERLQLSICQYSLSGTDYADAPIPFGRDPAQKIPRQHTFINSSL